MQRTLQLLAVAAFLATPTFAMAQSAIDGSLDAGYGAPKSVQLNPTSFGDANNADNHANGSELDAAYSYINPATHTLYLMLTGNLETNFNKLDVLVQAHGGGGASFPAAGGAFGNMTGLGFDAGFRPTHAISITSGNATNDVYVDYADLVAPSTGYIGTTTIGGSTSLSGGAINPLPGMRLAINNTNVVGVTGASAAGALTAVTGIELSFDLNDLGWDGGTVNIMAAINGGNNDYLSNQVLGSLPAGSPSLGNDGNGNYIDGSLSRINLDNVAGAQFFAVSVPEPVSVAAAVPAIALLGRRRRLA